MTGSQKAKEFNKMFLKFLKAGAKEIHSSVLNCIREMALMAAKTEEEEKEAK